MSILTSLIPNTSGSFSTLGLPDSFLTDTRYAVMPKIYDTSFRVESANNIQSDSKSNPARIFKKPFSTSITYKTSITVLCRSPCSCIATSNRIDPSTANSGLSTPVTLMATDILPTIPTILPFFTLTPTLNPLFTVTTNPSQTVTVLPSTLTTPSVASQSANNASPTPTTIIASDTITLSNLDTSSTKIFESTSPASAAPYKFSPRSSSAPAKPSGSTKSPDRTELTSTQSSSPTQPSSITQTSESAQASPVPSAIHQITQSSAPIAGYVLGAIAALAIITLITFILVRRRRKQARNGQIIPWMELSSISPRNHCNVRRKKDSRPLYQNLPSSDSGSWPEDSRETMEASVTGSDLGSGSIEPITARLDFLQNGMAWVVEHMQQLESQKDDIEMGESDAPPPAYVPGQN
ncbi:hypothetical protein GYMLUDRAFT_64681 [Collybiopsis luxurians FD-317 M1]|uniref:Mid2 domain-containing protein n=1 Tax=Collybiopsis luxurians FD-317 M1 TaxID=944289 RepID=A0A0D0C1L7_9AGAR|nr:hypothetical protein GYMLUDRAFT_64681 [Collybiopsis luxurians FD-317 M1]